MRNKYESEYLEKAKARFLSTLFILIILLIAGAANGQA
jgi:hypothetical protein